MVKFLGCKLECDDAELAKKLENALSTGCTSEEINKISPNLWQSSMRAMRSLMTKGCRTERLVIKDGTVQAFPSENLDNKSEVFAL